MSSIVIAGDTSGSVTLQAPAVAGSSVLSLPAVTDTVAGIAATQTLTNKTLTGAVVNGTVGATTPSTGAFTTLSASGVTTVQAGTAALPAITTTGDTNTGIFFPAADMIAFTEGGAEAMRIDSSGNLLVGTTAATGNPTQGAQILINSGESVVVIGHVTGTASGILYAGFSYAGSRIGSITQSGTTAVLYNVTSDQRLKENIVNAPEFGSVIDSIKVRSFDWKTDHTHQRAGFIAQELVTVAPEAVHQPEDAEDMMAVDYSKLVPMLVKEVQSLRKRLADAGIA